jgi:hypothetical protein
MRLVGVRDSDASAGNTLTRCIVMEARDCDDGDPAVFPSSEMVFSSDAGPDSGLTMTQPGLPPNFREIPVPCGRYDCLSVRDPRHTLSRRIDLVEDPVHRVFIADFEGEGLSLLSGDLTSDDVCDIIDFGVFVSQYSRRYPGGGLPDSGDTTCSTPYPHADTDGDGLVFTGDFTAIQINFLRTGEGACCSSGPLQTPRPSITVAELESLGLGSLTPADLTDDGVVDMSDIAAFAQGERPESPRPHAEEPEASPGAGAVPAEGGRPVGPVRRPRP